MRRPHSDKLAAGTGLAAASATALLAWFDSKTGMAVATPATVSALFVLLRLLWSVPIDQQRARRLLDIAARNPDPEASLRQVMLAKRLYPSDEALHAEVRARLREISEAFDPAAVEPLYRLLQARVSARLASWECSAIAELVRPLDAEQLDTLRGLFEETMEKTDEDDLDLPFVSWIDPDGQRKLGVDIGEQRATVDDPRSHIFRLLQSSGVGLPRPVWSGPGSFVGDGSTGENADRVQVERSMVRAALSVLRA